MQIIIGKIKKEFLSRYKILVRLNKTNFPFPKISCRFVFIREAEVKAFDSKTKTRNFTVGRKLISIPAVRPHLFQNFSASCPPYSNVAYLLSNIPWKWISISKNTPFPFTIDKRNSRPKIEFREFSLRSGEIFY